MTKQFNLLSRAAIIGALTTAFLVGTPYLASAQNQVARRDAPNLRFENQSAQNTLGRAYQNALDNLLIINSVNDKNNKNNPTGLMAPDNNMFIKAGGGYDTPWTRDASINTWNAGSLLEPVVARNTLWAVCQKQEDGAIVLQRDDQWWDKVIWISAAWNHYKVTGDQQFLTTAYSVAQDELALMRREHYSQTYGLFQGPAFFADGIAAYPEQEYDSTVGSNFVLSHPYTKDLMALSTNCAYYAAYRNAALMGQQLARPASETKGFNDTAQELKTAINARLWNAKKGTYSYFIHGAGPLVGQRDETQEGIGLSYAILFGVADAAQAKSIVKTAHVTDYGITTEWPHFPRFSDEKPGRHNVSVWPLVNGMWASAAAQSGDMAMFETETTKAAQISLGSEGRFYEIYNFSSGQPDGGWQGGHWVPLPDQTWSASAYLRMIYDGLFGMNFQPDGLTLTPRLPGQWKTVALEGVRYRAMTLDIKLQGAGNRIARVMIDGKNSKNAFVPANLTGKHTVEISLKQG